ncbi:MAG TPA: FkbM family methyltransferase [Chitinophagales bacterium]|nr:FkbM family methyltransferase [Chitinophagales bacterium]HNM31219.1 FkbM family methyltransferase [Chitinophagales bacterium]
MSLKTDILNVFRRIVQWPVAERILLEKIKNGNTLSKKIIAGPNLYPKNTIRTCIRDGIKYRLDISDYMEHAIYFNINDTVDFDRRFLYSIIQPDFICFDVGANIGETTLNFAKLATEGKIYSFEPVPFLYNRLKTNINLNTFNNIELHNLALSDREEELYFENPKNSNSAGISMHKEYTTTANVVHSTTIDAFIFQNNISKIDFIKIDVEGFEHYVINGARNTLLQHKPLLFIEIDNRYLKTKNTSEKIILTLLASEFGYTLYRIDGMNKIKITTIEDTDTHYDVFCVWE